jgi:uncharacterized membrane protein
MTVLKHVGVVSVAKIMAVMGLVFGFIMGIFAGILTSALGAIVPGGGGLAAGIGIMSIIFATIAGAIGGFICGAVLAFLYNLFAGLVGGIELELA